VNATEVLEAIERGFAGTAHPGDPFLLGSHDGDEPFQEVSAFYGVADWHALTAEFLDQHYTALSFFSEGGLRYYLPAYLMADVRDELQTADPVLHLVHGFSEMSMTHTVSDRAFTRPIGRRQFINPRRYGASTFLDYARYRLSVFSREEAGANVRYLEFTRRLDSRSADVDRIDAALAGFWRERAVSAPTAAELTRHLEEEAVYVAALLRDRDTPR
jgi:hypothetical protein